MFDYENPNLQLNNNEQLKRFFYGFAFWELLSNEIERINKRIKQIENTKTYKEKINNTIRLIDYNAVCLEINGYKHIKAQLIKLLHEFEVSKL